MLTHLTTMENVYWLVDILLKSSVLLALAGLATLACWRASAAFRHLIWTLAIIGVLLMPVLSAVLPAWHAVRLPEWKAPPARIQARATRPVAEPVTRDSPQPVTTTPAVETTAPQELAPSVPTIAAPAKPILSWPVLLLLAWGIGTLLVLGWWAYGYIIARGIVRRATPAPDTWAAEVPVDIRLLLSAEIAMPLLVGIMRPTILLPASAVEWPEARRRVVLLHELTHHQRRDLPTCLLVQLACALYWMNPLVWIAAYCMRTERETACDDAVLAADITPSDYAAHLLAMASALQGRRPTRAAGIAMACSSKVGKRIKGVLDMHRNRKSLSFWGVLAAVVVTLPLLVTLAVAEVSPKAAKANAFAQGEVQQYTADAQLPTFTAIAGQRWNKVVASPSGRYLAVPNPRISGELGIWVCDLQTDTWTKVWDKVGEIQWLPDESGMIVAVGGEREIWAGQPRPSCIYYRVSLTKAATQLTTVANLCNWLLIPDSSGLVAKCVGDQKKDKDGSMERVETRVYSFADNKWTTKHTTEFGWHDGLVSNSLALRNDKGAWVLSYDDRRTGDNSEWWVNLTTGEAMEVDGGDERYYSPDGQYAVDDNHLYRARSWPQPPEKGYWGGNALEKEIRTYTVHFYNNPPWAPDGRHLAGIEGESSRVDFFDLDGNKVFSREGGFETWVGGSHILVREDNKGVLYPIDGGAGRAVYQVSFTNEVKISNMDPASLASLPTFTPPPVNSWQHAVASSSGRYLAVPYTRIPGGSGIWLCDLQTNKWTKVWDKVGEIQWLPDESGMIVAVGKEYESKDGVFPRSNCTLYRISPTGVVSKLTELSNPCEWLVIPDGSGLVANFYAERPQSKDVNVNISTSSFSNPKWVTKTTVKSELGEGGGGIGDNLVLRKHEDAWVLSYDEYGGGDNNGRWVNLTTGEWMQVRSGDERIYSPDGLYAVDSSGQLINLHTWPNPPDKKDVFGNAVANKIRKFPGESWNCLWSPDGRHFAFQENETPYVNVFDFYGNRVFRASNQDNHSDIWVGEQKILVRKDNKLILYPINGDAGRVIFLLASADDVKKSSELAPKGL